MDFKNISDLQVHTLTLAKARAEQSETLGLLEYLREVETRRVFAKMGYKSLWQYTVTYLGYSECGASERLNALKLLSSVPEVKSQLQVGEFVFL